MILTLHDSVVAFASPREVGAIVSRPRLLGLRQASRHFVVTAALLLEATKEESKVKRKAKVMLDRAMPEHRQLA